MRISDWSSDVCSSDLVPLAPPLARALGKLPAGDDRTRGAGRGARGRPARLAGPGGVAAVPARRLVVAAQAGGRAQPPGRRAEEHTSELQSLMRISYAVFCLKKKITHKQHTTSVSPS